MAVKQEKQDERAAVNQKAEKLLKDYGNSILRMAYAYLHNMSDAANGRIRRASRIGTILFFRERAYCLPHKTQIFSLFCNERFLQLIGLPDTIVINPVFAQVGSHFQKPCLLMGRVLQNRRCLQIRQKIPQKPQKPGEEKPAVEGVYAPQEVASAEKLTDAAGFPVRDIASLKEKATDRSYVTYGDGLAEITYRWDSQSICFRQSQGQEDNSGDYTHYAEEKLIVVGKYSVTFKGQEKGSYMLATWSDGTYSFSVSATQALKKAEFLGLLRKLKKIFEKFKKVVDFIARLYYNLSCDTDETQTTRTQQHSLRGVAQLG